LVTVKRPSFAKGGPIGALQTFCIGPGDFPLLIHHACTLVKW
jgi:hypothetical protein